MEQKATIFGVWGTCTFAGGLLGTALAVSLGASLIEWLFNNYFEQTVIMILVIVIDDDDEVNRDDRNDCGGNCDD